MRKLPADQAVRAVRARQMVRTVRAAQAIRPIRAVRAVQAIRVVRTGQAVRAVLTVVALLAAVVACSASPRARGADGQDTGQASAAPANLSTGCGKPLPAAGRNKVKVAGISLNYLLTVPAGFPNTTPAPVVLNYHGLGSNAVQQDAYTRLPIAGANLGYIVVTPETTSGLPGWILPGFGEGRLRDRQVEIRAAKALLDHIEATLCVDTTKEFATGMSNGAGMAAALICGLDGRLAAVAPVSGITIVEPCDHPRPTSIITFQGNADRVIRIEGGPIGLPTRVRGFVVPAWVRAVRLPSFDTTLTRWATAMGCGRAVESVPTADVALRTFNCDGGATVQAYVIDQGGHTWPGGVRLGALGSTTTLDATELILEAFSRNAAPR